MRVAQKSCDSRPTDRGIHFARSTQCDNCQNDIIAFYIICTSTPMYASPPLSNCVQSTDFRVALSQSTIGRIC